MDSTTPSAEELKIKPNSIKSTFRVPEGGPKAIFSGHGQNPSLISELMSTPLDLSNDGMKIITPFEVIQGQIEDHITKSLANPALEEHFEIQRDGAKQRSLRAKGEMIPLNEVVNTSTIPKNAELETSIFGDGQPYTDDTDQRPSKRPKLLSLCDAGIHQNSLVIPKVDRDAMVPLKPNAAVKVENDQKVPADEVVIDVAFYHPERQTKTDLFRVLASQTLDQLAQTFYCVTDQKVSAECKDDSFFYIEGTFYSRAQEGSDLDSSRHIRSWAPTVEEGSNRFQGNNIKAMANQTFGELDIIVDKPYVYYHAGGCCHYMVFTSVRLMNSSNPLNQSAYPDHIMCVKPRTRRCDVCKTRRAVFVTYNDRLCAESPSFFCDSCYEQLHYEVSEKEDIKNLLYDDFQVYPYLHE